jgi:hypothetical protein
MRSSKRGLRLCAPCANRRARTAAFGRAAPSTLRTLQEILSVSEELLAGPMAVHSLSLATSNQPTATTLNPAGMIVYFRGLYCTTPLIGTPSSLFEQPISYQGNFGYSPKVVVRGEYTWWLVDESMRTSPLHMTISCNEEHRGRRYPAFIRCVANLSSSHGTAYIHAPGLINSQSAYAPGPSGSCVHYD